MRKKRQSNKQVTEYRVFKKRGVSEGEKVKVHYNLHEGGFTIASAKTGLVLAYAPVVNLINVKTTVRENDRQMVIAKGAKNVHAHIVGYFTFNSIDMEGARQMTYNPYVHATFVDKETKEPILIAEQVLCVGKGALYK